MARWGNKLQNFSSVFAKYLLCIDSFQSRPQPLCKLLGIKESFEHAKRVQFPKRVAHWWELVRALASNQCGLGSNNGVDATCFPYMGWVCCWFSPLLWEVFLRVLWFSPVLDQHLIRNVRTRFNEFLWSPKCSVVKQITIFNFYNYGNNKTC